MTEDPVSGSRSSDLLMEYLSAVGSGSWQTFRTAVRSADTVAGGEVGASWKVTVTARNLSALGHMEHSFDSDTNWSIAPAVLAGTPGYAEGTAVLCGSRSPELLEAVTRHAAGLDVAYLSEAQHNGPSVVRLHGTDRLRLTEVAAAARLRLIEDASSDIARILPSIGSMVRISHEAPLPVGAQLEQFNTVRHRWMQADGVRGPGAYRFKTYKHEYRLVSSASCKVMPAPVAIYATLARAGTLPIAYDEECRSLAIPAAAPLPELYGRALVLASGELATYEAKSGTLRFSCVSRELCERVVLGLSTLEEEDLE